MYRYSYVFKWCGYNASIRTSIIGIVYYVLFMCVYYLWWYGQIFKDIAPAGLNAFGTCSSSATIPISLKCATEKIGIPEEITSLTLPLGTTIDMDAVSILMSLMITFFATALDFKACHLDFSHFVAMQDTLILDMKKCGHTMKSCFGF